MNECFEELVEPESGCCGMAGVFGLRESTSLIGDTRYQRKLADVVSNASTATRIVSDGYSCRKQIQDNSDMKVWHPVEIIDACITEEAKRSI